MLFFSRIFLIPEGMQVVQQVFQVSECQVRVKLLCIGLRQSSFRLRNLGIQGAGSRIKLCFCDSVRQGQRDQLAPLPLE